MARIWRSQPPQRGVLQPISAPHLELSVFGKVQFDRRGLIVAERDGEPVGFVHAAFGPDELGRELDKTMGSTIALMLKNGQPDGSLAGDLLQASEEYLRSEGATVLYAGGIRPFATFYLGLYGGSEIPGILQSDDVFLGAVREANYREIDQVRILQCDLVSFRPPVSHQLRAVKRTTEIVEALNPPNRSWWDACTWATLQRDRFELRDKYQHRVLATAQFWDVQPLSTGWGMCTVGLFQMETDAAHRRRGYATYLLGEAIRMLRRRGVASIEVQTMAANEAALQFYAKMGFSEIDAGFVFRKEGGTA
ncbi:MAG: GNAT family N-acetyltransferase [Planctomycetales bacterium]|nr:GNAT family N-acetyltransferase [Planctomycetales bacterium]